MRRADFGTLLCPEFPLRDLPRITVRGHSVQNDSVPLRKAPLPSRVYPWSTKRPCGPLAFRRATEGSRVQRKVRGVKRGQETILGVLSPFALRRGHGVSAAEGGHFPRHVMANIPRPGRAYLACGGKPPERRNRSPSAEGKSHGASSRLHRLRRCIGGGSPLC